MDSITTMDDVASLALAPSRDRLAGVGQMLAMRVLDGYWTLEQLDQPSASHQAANTWRARNRLPPIEHSNLAREWIAAHPEQWDALLRSKLRDELEGS